MTTGLAIDIKHFFIHDGPGIHSNVFLKDCRLQYQWCHNPKRGGKKPDVVLRPGRCIGCGTHTRRTAHDSF